MFFEAPLFEVQESFLLQPGDRIPHLKLRCQSVTIIVIWVYLIHIKSLCQPERHPLVLAAPRRMSRTASPELSCGAAGCWSLPVSSSLPTARAWSQHVWNPPVGKRVGSVQCAASSYKTELRGSFLVDTNWKSGFFIRESSCTYLMTISDTLNHVKLLLQQNMKGNIEVECSRNPGFVSQSKLMVFFSFSQNRDIIQNSQPY